VRLAAALLVLLSSGAEPPLPVSRSITSLAPLDEAVYRKLRARHRGKVLLVNFWATWCEPCREEMPYLAALARKHRARGFVLATISADEPEDKGAAAAFLRSAGVDAPAFLKRVRNDDAFITSVDREWSGALPASFLFDRKGSQAARFIGEADLKELEAAIEKLL
jgi:thiol-disulfide isomerase/thioredoxin